MYNHMSEWRPYMETYCKTLWIYLMLFLNSNWKMVETANSHIFFYYNFKKCLKKPLWNKINFRIKNIEFCNFTHTQKNMKKCLVKHMQTYPPNTKNSLEARLPAVPIGISSEEKKRKTQSVLLNHRLKVFIVPTWLLGNNLITIQIYHLLMFWFCNNKLVGNTAPSWTHRLPTSPFFKVNCHAYCHKYVFLHHLIRAKSVLLFLPCSISHVTDKGFGCCSPNPNLP